jgi:hypothetical protein
VIASTLEDAHVAEMGADAHLVLVVVGIELVLGDEASDLVVVLECILLFDIFVKSYKTNQKSDYVLYSCMQEKSRECYHVTMTSQEINCHAAILASYINSPIWTDLS